MGSQSLQTNFHMLCCCVRSRADPSGRAVWGRGSAAARLLGLRPRIPPGAWVVFLCCEAGLCDGQIPRPEESYRVCALVSVIRCNNNPLHLQWI